MTLLQIYQFAEKQGISIDELNMGHSVAIDIMSFSRDSLIRQLEYDGFTHEQAVYGAEANGY